MVYTLGHHDPAYLGKVRTFLRDYGGLSSKRTGRMEDSVLKRSRKVLTIVDHTHHAHNVSAILRSIEAFGFMECIFLYSNPLMKFRISDAVDRGSSKWLILKRGLSIQKLVCNLKKKGYKIALVSLPSFSKTFSFHTVKAPSLTSWDLYSSKNILEDLNHSKVALVFGSELNGLTEEWFQFVDLFISVPMQGFVESLNISVCAAILLQAFRYYYTKHAASDFPMLKFEQEIILDYWYLLSGNKTMELLRSCAPHLVDYAEFLKSKAFLTFEKD